MNRMTKWVGAAAFAVAVLGAPAAFAADDLGARAIVDKDWQTAEAQILVGLEQHPGDVFRLLNLAAVYGQTGRENEAAAIYRDILESDSERVAALATGASQPVQSVAERGLLLLEAE